MSRMRIVGGDIESLRKLGLSNDPLVAKPRPEQGGSLSDPVGMLVDALGRFEEVPDRPSTIQRAQDLCRFHQVEDARFFVQYEPDMDVVIVLHPTPGKSAGVEEGTFIQTDRYMVFGRKLEGKKQGVCYACNNADKRYGPSGTKPNPRAIHKGVCYRTRWFDNWVPMVFAWAHGIDDAEDLAMELTSAWSATAEQQLDDNGKIDWSRLTERNMDDANRREFSFSSDYVAGFIAARPDAWSSLSADEQAEQL